MDTDDSKLCEQEEKLLNRMIESTNHWDGKHVVIHGIHQFTPLQLRFITHLDKLDVEVIFIHNYVPEYKAVYSSLYVVTASFLQRHIGVAGLEAKAIACSLSALSLSFNSC